MKGLFADTFYFFAILNPRDAAHPKALAVAKSIQELRGNTPRLYQNTLIFLAADKTRLQDLDEAARKYLAWQSILAEKEILDLAPQQVKQAETQLEAADGAVTARIPETYQWLLVPIQESPQAAVRLVDSPPCHHGRRLDADLGAGRFRVG